MRLKFYYLKWFSKGTFCIVHISVVSAVTENNVRRN